MMNWLKSLPPWIKSTGVLLLLVGVVYGAGGVKSDLNHDRERTDKLEEQFEEFCSETNDEISEINDRLMQIETSMKHLETLSQNILNAILEGNN